MISIIYLFIFFITSSVFSQTTVFYKDSLCEAKISFYFKNIYKDKLNYKITILSLRNSCNLSKNSLKKNLKEKVANKIASLCCLPINSKKVFKLIETLIKLNLIKYIPNFLNLIYMGQCYEEPSFYSFGKMITLCLTLQLVLLIKNHLDPFNFETLFPAAISVLIFIVYLRLKLVVINNPQSKINIINKVDKYKNFNFNIEFISKSDLNKLLEITLDLKLKKLKLDLYKLKFIYDTLPEEIAANIALYYWSYN